MLRFSAFFLIVSTLAACAQSNRAPGSIEIVQGIPYSEKSDKGEHIPALSESETVAKCGADGPLCINNLESSLNEILEAKGKLWGEAYRFMGQVLISQEGEVLYNHGFGFSDRKTKQINDADTNFRIGSVTKQFTAAAILRLQEQGKLKVGDTIAMHLPKYPQESASKITIHHLLTHTSGIFNFTQDPAIMKTRHLKRSIDEILAMFSRRPLEFEPGSQYRYSNSGYAVLGAIIEKASGRTLGEYFQQEFFGPVGLSRTVLGDAVGLENRAVGYSVSPEERVIEAKTIDMSLPFSAGAIRSTANDLARWDKALREGKVLQPVSMEAFYRPERNNYAYGWFVKNREGQRVIRHGGGIDGFRTSYIRIPMQKLVIVVWTNQPNLDPGIIGDAALDLLYGKNIEIRHELPLASPPKAEVPRITGYYLLDESSRDALIKDGVASDYIKTFGVLKVVAEGDSVIVRFSEEPPFRIYSRGAGPGDYFAKQDFTLFDFELNSDGEKATQLSFEQGENKLSFRRDDEAGEKLWPTKNENKTENKNH